VRDLIPLMKLAIGKPPGPPLSPRSSPIRSSPPHFGARLARSSSSGASAASASASTPHSILSSGYAPHNFTCSIYPLNPSPSIRHQAPSQLRMLTISRLKRRGPPASCERTARMSHALPVGREPSVKLEDRVLERPPRSAIAASSSRSAPLSLASSAATASHDAGLRPSLAIL
jgi:hypothetical protein